jgi:hypothetical protein
VGAKHNRPRLADGADEPSILATSLPSYELHVVGDQLRTIPSQLIQNAGVKCPGQRCRTQFEIGQRPIVERDDHDVAWRVPRAPDAETGVDRVELQ